MLDLNELGLVNMACVRELELVKAIRVTITSRFYLAILILFLSEAESTLSSNHNNK